MNAVTALQLSEKKFVIAMKDAIKTVWRLIVNVSFFMKYNYVLFKHARAYYYHDDS